MTMETTASIEALWVIGALLAIMAIWVFGVRPLIDETARLQLFKLRDALFDEASGGDLDFEMRDYVEARRLINLHIRYLHKLDGLQILLILFTRDWVGKIDMPKIENTLCQNVVNRAVLISAGNAMLKSPLILFVVGVFLCIRAIARGGSDEGPFDKLRRRLASSIGIASSADAHRAPG
jgi:hypothetical protein